MRVISEEKLIKLAFRIDDHNTVVSLDDALAECRELQEPWMTLDEFLKSGFRGVCFVFTEPYTILCERTNCGFFAYNSKCLVDISAITDVMPIHKPEPPR